MASVQTVAIAVLVGLMMFAVGLRVARADIVAVLRQRALLARVLAANVVGVPLIAVLITVALPVPTPVAIGLLLCAAAPGGPLGPVLAGLATADLTLATAVMVVLAVVSVVTTPVVVALTLPDLVAEQVGMFPLFTTILTWQLVPLAAGMFLRECLGTSADRLARPAATTANTLLAVIVVALVVTRAEVLADLGLASIVAMGLLVGAVLVSGRLLVRRPGQGRAVAMCSSVRNLALALLVAAAHLRDPAVDAALLSFGLVMLGTSALLALWWRRGWEPGRSATRPRLLATGRRSARGPCAPRIDYSACSRTPSPVRRRSAVRDPAGG